MSDLITKDKNYREWIQSVSKEFRKSQLKAAVKVNEQMLRFYWMLGRDISSMNGASRYGTDFYSNVSKDLTEVLPDVKSFSVTNLRYMVRFYELYPNALNLQGIGADYTEESNLPQAGADYADYKEEPNLPQLGANFEPPIFRIPWGHNKLIIDKCKKAHDKACFFVNETLNNGWSRAVLLNFLDTDLFERKGMAVTNFNKSLPSVTSDLAQQITKDPYNFDFLTLRQNYDEKELKDALMDNLQRFLLELGTGFAFLGREYRLAVGNTEQFLDMLFYNVRLHSYVVIEVKITEFDPRDMGQLGTYVAAVDGILRADGDSPTIGLLVCKTKDNVLAQYSVNNVKSPVGISSYELSKLMPENFKSSMPTIEEIENELK